MVINISTVSIREHERQRFWRTTAYMAALNVLAYYYYGLRAVIITLVCVFVSVLTEYLCTAAMGRKFNWSDSSPIMSGMILALIMPASVPYRVVVVTSALMASVFKQAFGGSTNVIFSPAAVAYAFAALTWPNYILRYPTPVPFGKLSLASDISDVLGRSFTYSVDNSLSSAGYLDIIWGKLAGPMGTSCVLVIAICAIALYFFGDIEPPVLFSAVAVNVLVFVLFPISSGGWQAALYSLTTGSFMFVLTFMACDSRFTPKRTFAQVLYGSVFSLTSYLLRRFSGFENSAVFALIIVSLFAVELDRLDIGLNGLLLGLGRYVSSLVRKLWIYTRFKGFKEDTITYPLKQEKKRKKGVAAADKEMALSDKSSDIDNKMLDNNSNSDNPEDYGVSGESTDDGE